MSKKVEIIDSEDQSGDRYVVIIQSVAGSCKENRECNTTENKDRWFKQGKGSRVHDGRMGNVSAEKYAGMI